MSQAPAMPLFWGDYWSKTRRLSPAQHHAYLFLLGATWMNNCRPFQDDDETIAGEIGISVSAWRKVRPTIVRFFDLSDGTWRSRKLEEVWADVMRRVEKNRENGRLGGRPPKHNQPGKPQQNQPQGKPKGSVSVNPNESIQSQSRIEGESGSKVETLPEKTEPSNTAKAPFYEFSGRVIRLTTKDLEAWRGSYHGIADIGGELQALDDFYAETLSAEDQKRWFIRCSSALDKKHQEAIAAKKLAQRPLEERYPNEGVYRKAAG